MTKSKNKEKYDVEEDKKILGSILLGVSIFLFLGMIINTIRAYKEKTPEDSENFYLSISSLFLTIISIILAALSVVGTI